MNPEETVLLNINSYSTDVIGFTESHSTDRGESNAFDLVSGYYYPANNYYYVCQNKSSGIGGINIRTKKYGLIPWGDISKVTPSYTLTFNSSGKTGNKYVDNLGFNGNRVLYFYNGFKYGGGKPSSINHAATGEALHICLNRRVCYDVYEGIYRAYGYKVDMMSIDPRYFNINNYNISYSGRGTRGVALFYKEKGASGFPSVIITHDIADRSKSSSGYSYSVTFLY